MVRWSMKNVMSLYPTTIKQKPNKNHPPQTLPSNHLLQNLIDFFGSCLAFGFLHDCSDNEVKSLFIPFFVIFSSFYVLLKSFLAVFLKLFCVRNSCQALLFYICYDIKRLLNELLHQFLAYILRYLPSLD